ncbi:hypothetical protein TNCV_997131 [Trichonephila clavipes]|uniref:Uncharacterized protein n=1 Tax=Trichonephila clavipes TaxID=2585209 RepID=A0A8X6WGB6_TRICX|nr:hypothetical protein TNCV_997131 [Trichonephila clavipes]
MGKEGDISPCKKTEVKALLNAKLFSNREISRRLKVSEAKVRRIKKNIESGEEPQKKEKMRQKAYFHPKLTKLKLDDHGRRRRRRLFPEGWAKKINHDEKIKKSRKLPQKTGREDVPQSTKRSNEAKRRRGEGKNAGRKTGRLKAVNQDGERSPQNPE